MFELILTNESEDLSLFFKIRNTAVAKKWFNELQKSYKLREVDRFSNWNDTSYIVELNAHIYNINNNYKNIIDRTVSHSTTQADLNYLHRIFEELSKELSNTPGPRDSMPLHLLHSIDQLNILIHKLESLLRTHTKHPTIVVTFDNIQRFELDDNDVTHFTFKWGTGTVYIDYCQVGKSVLDVYKDADFNATATPQTYYSADFVIKFGPTTRWITHFVRSILINRWLRTKNFKFTNLNIGMIPVADLQTKIDKATLIKFNKVKAIICLK
jgi:hypothetical protein